MVPSVRLASLTLLLLSAFAVYLVVRLVRGEGLVLPAPQLEPDVGESAVRMGDGV